jgi:hypothetical protein
MSLSRARVKRAVGIVQSAALRTIARNRVAKVFHTSAMPLKWQGEPGVRSVTVPGGPIGLRLGPRQEDVNLEGLEKPISVRVTVVRPLSAM